MIRQEFGYNFISRCAQVDRVVIENGCSRGKFWNGKKKSMIYLGRQMFSDPSHSKAFVIFNLTIITNPPLMKSSVEKNT